MKWKRWKYFFFFSLWRSVLWWTIRNVWKLSDRLWKMFIETDLHRTDRCSFVDCLCRHHWTHFIFKTSRTTSFMGSELDHRSKRSSTYDFFSSSSCLFSLQTTKIVLAMRSAQSKSSTSLNRQSSGTNVSIATNASNITNVQQVFCPIGYLWVSLNRFYSRI